MYYYLPEYHCIIDAIEQDWLFGEDQLEWFVENETVSILTGKEAETLYRNVDIRMAEEERELWSDIATDYMSDCF